ncbi:NAD(P)H-hydrate dehydratase [Paraglaciecola aquimarina]|uniref:NAD(P)H-hydrate dehydratase n=1 Tax=Paraglaciecola aquimarina TaxID=1235557 RepID=A0ABU3SUC6_9ALTE|nr:NAD(P)H-hydrate dehydratase [Paraglaciecola aquimarina]MDU0353616.1 NAD(P)H-hydrate dehydratase [Paraglaciecola aquimarina]
MLNCEISAIENDRFLGSKQIADSFMSTCILKGNGTLIYSHTQDTEEQCHGVCNGGNPGMATAGMGDLLTGIVGALLAQGMTEQQAATYAVCAHAEAGDRVAREYGQRGMIASDLLQPLRAIINLL